jgi:endonuclease/exonuclease/phosphatase family metal-dependent hydrolase
MQKLRVMTYNIFEGAAGERLGILASVVKSAQPDVLGVTEANGFDDAKRLAEVEKALGMKGHIIKAHTGFHVGLFTTEKWKVEAHGHEFAPFFHAAMWGRIRIDASRTLTVVVAHLNPFSPAARLDEIRALCRHAIPGERVVVMGDFNCMSPGDPIDESVMELPKSILARFVKEGADPAEFDRREIALLEWTGFVDVYRKLNPKKPGWTLMTTRFGASLRSRMRIDYLFASPRFAQRAVEADVIESDESRRASDHYPLVATFDLERGERTTKEKRPG